MEWPRNPFVARTWPQILFALVQLHVLSIFLFLNRENLLEKEPDLEKYGITLTDYPRRLTTRADWDMSRRELTDQYSPGNLLRGN